MQIIVFLIEAFILIIFALQQCIESRYLITKLQIIKRSAYDDTWIFPKTTYLFLQLTILTAEALHLHFQLFQLALLLQPTLESTFAILQQSPLTLAQIARPDFLFNLINFSRSGALRL